MRDGAVEWCGTASTTCLIDIGTVLNEGLDRSRTPETHGMMQRGHSILVGCMDVRTLPDRCDDSPTLVRWFGITFATNVEEFRLHDLVYGAGSILNLTTLCLENTQDPIGVNRACLREMPTLDRVIPIRNSDSVR